MYMQIGRTPLMVAILNGKTETFRLILDAGAETRCFDNVRTRVKIYNFIYSYYLP